MKVEHIQEFVKLAETENFSKAAELSFTSQPNLSRHIKALERELGVQLFERTTTQVRITEAGKILFRRFADIDTAYTKAMGELRAYLHPSKSSLIIGAPLYCLARYVEPAISYFQEKFPQFASPSFVNIPRENAVEEIRKGKCDVFIGSFDWIGKARGIEACPFAKEQYYAAMLCDDELAHHEAIQTSDLQGRIVIIPPKPHHGTNEASERLTNYLKSSKTEVAEILYTPQEDSYALMVKSTGGIAVIPDCMRQERRNDLVFLPCADGGFLSELSVVNICCFYDKVAANSNPAIKLFCRSIRFLFSKTAEESA